VISNEPQTDGIQLTPEQVIAISRALADPRRFAMLQQIAAEPVLPCSGLAMHRCIRPATVSHHLKELQTAGLITVEREGRGLRMALRREVWRAYLRELGSL
jgi:ArsR family transcriptional regulator